MFSALRLVLKYIRWYLSASNSRGHGVHSPFVFNYIRNVLLERKPVPGSEKIEGVRKTLLKDHSILHITDLGAGSLHMKNSTRRISQIASSSLKPPKYAAILARTASYLDATTILELGTSLGITTSYLASGHGKVYTIEGDPAVAEVARETFRKVDGHIELVTGDFAGVLPATLQKTGKIDMAYIDGNHRLEPTLKYYEMILPSLSENGFMVFDDIYWSGEMEEAWRQIKDKPEVTLTIDLFFIGLVFFNPEFKVKQHFRLRH